MIGLDTNVLVRYFAQDDPEQSRKATVLIEQQLTQQNPGFVSIVALAETVWVLKRAYRLNNEQIGVVVQRMLEADVLVMEHEPEVGAAMRALREGHGWFTDALIGLINRSSGCARTVTFDRKALKLPWFNLL
jgi:predicted nucleic-acid-binding protein